MTFVKITWTNGPRSFLSREFRYHWRLCFLFSFFFFRHPFTMTNYATGFYFYRVAATTKSSAGRQGLSTSARGERVARIFFFSFESPRDENHSISRGARIADGPFALPPSDRSINSSKTRRCSITLGYNPRTQLERETVAIRERISGTGSRHASPIQRLISFPDHPCVLIQLPAMQLWTSLYPRVSWNNWALYFNASFFGFWTKKLYSHSTAGPAPRYIAVVV